MNPTFACKGAEKAFVAFADQIAKEWGEESRRVIYGDNWFKSAVARVILFRAAEATVSKAAWYEGGYRAQIVAYTCARLAKLALDQEGSGGPDYIKAWAQQSAGDVLEQQIANIAEVMARVLQSPPLAGLERLRVGQAAGVSKDGSGGTGSIRDGLRRLHRNER